MANAFQTVDWMAMECLDLLVNKLAVVSNLFTGYTEDFSKPYAVNDSIRIKKPQRFLIRDGLGYSANPINRQYTTVNCNQVFGIDFEWDSYEKAVRMERSEAQLSKEYLQPAMAQIAQEWDSRAAQFLYQNANNFVGVLGTDPTTFDATSAAARQRLVELGGATDEGDRCMIVPPNVMRALKNTSLTYFNPVTDLNKQWRTGIVGSGDGFEWYESMSLYSHTSGVWAGAVTVTTAPVSGDTTLSVTCTTGDTFKQGDAFDIAATKQVNPMTRRVTAGSVLKPFVLTATTTGASAAATLNIAPAIYGPGSQYQNVDVLPVAGAALTMFRGTAAPTAAHSGVNGMAFTTHAAAFVSLPLEKPTAAEVSWQKRDPDTGVTVRFVRMFDPQQSKMVNRFDCLGGFGPLYMDECAVRILGA